MMVLMRIFDSADTAFTYVMEKELATQTRDQWKDWLSDTLTHDNDAVLQVSAFGDNFSRSPVEIIVKMSRITGMTITEIRPETVS